MGLLKISNLSKTYQDNKNNPVKALDKVSYDFPNHGLVFITGKSGSGKSTLLNLIGGVDSQDCGEILVNNQNISDFNNDQKDAYKNTLIGFVFQDFNLIENYTVNKNISLALELQGKYDNKDKIDEVLKKIDLEDYNLRLPKELSGGERQRVAVARALVKESRVILADEPAASLDTETKNDIYQLLKYISCDKLVIVATHDIDSANLYGDLIITIEDGKIIDENHINKLHFNQNENMEIKYISPKFSFTNMLLGVKSITTKRPFRLLLTTILFCVVSIMSGFLISMSTVDKASVVRKLFENNDINSVTITKYQQDSLINMDLSDTQNVKKMSETINLYNVYLFEEHSFLDYSSTLYNHNRSNNEYYCYTWFQGFMGLDEKTAHDLNFNLLSGTYPVLRKDGIEEIVVSEYVYEQFQLGGYLNYNSETIEIESYNDLIGKRIRIDDSYYYISGILKTNSKLDKFNYLKNPNANIKNGLFSRFIGTSPDLFVFTRMDYFDDNSINIVKYLYTRTDNLDIEDVNILLDLHYNNDSFKLNNYLINSIDTINYHMMNTRNLFLIGLFVIIVFSLIFMINYNQYTILTNHKYFGILRSLGVRKLNIVSFYGFFGLALSLIAIGISLIGSGYLLERFNDIIIDDRIPITTMYTLNTLAVITMIIITVLTIMFACIIPILSKLKKNSITLLNRKE